MNRNACLGIPLRPSTTLEGEVRMSEQHEQPVVEPDLTVDAESLLSH